MSAYHYDSDLSVSESKAERRAFAPSMTPEPRYLRAYRLGDALLRLIEAKAARGQDFYLCSSWCSDSTGLVVIVRRSGARIGQPVFDVCPVRALGRAAR